MKGEEFTVGDKVETTTCDGLAIRCTVVCRIGDYYKLDSPAHGYIIGRYGYDIKRVETTRKP